MSDDLSNIKVGDWVVLYLVPKWAEEYGDIVAGPVMGPHFSRSWEWEMKVMVGPSGFSSNSRADFFFPDPTWFYKIAVIPMGVTEDKCGS